MRPVTPLHEAEPLALEFFAGIGLARMGLEEAGFRVAWANDVEPRKMAMYESQFGSTDAHTFHLGDIAHVDVEQLPRNVSLAWASSPCTDLSLAGARAGLTGRRSSTFWEFVRLLRDMDESRPPVAVLENVTGLATSHGGRDIAAALSAFNELGYSVDVLAIDARRFVPQSRPRLFLVGAQNPPTEQDATSSELRPDWLRPIYEHPSLKTHRAQLPAPPTLLTEGLGSLMEDVPMSDERWWDETRTTAFLESLSPAQRRRVAALQNTPGVKFRTAYRRTRRGVAVWEVRPDDVSGCLRTARGGSSKQAVARMGNDQFQVRWMTPREYARLMGAGEYRLEHVRPNQALFGFGDAVAVPVVTWLAANYLMPLAQGTFRASPQMDQGLLHG